MRRENKREAELEFKTEIREDDKIVAFCTGCRSIIFKGTDATFVQNRVLRRSLQNHLEQTNWEHEIDIIYVNRNEDAIIEAGLYLSTPARLTAQLGLKEFIKHNGRLI
ncbi:MAG TPA: hypothetical protein VKC54_00450 [Patescibacteria group bacterium]|nr:hypothetical protein [Patescibacteria group bacterium]